PHGLRARLLLLLVVALLPTSIAAGGDAAPGPSDLELVVLGSGGPRAFGRGATSYLVLVGSQARILVDAGPAALVELGKVGIVLEHLDIVLLSHLHVDHTGDLQAVLLGRSLTTKEPKIRFDVFGPDAGPPFRATTQFVRLLFGPGGAWEYQKTFG